MRYSILILLLCFTCISFTQRKTDVYFLHGQGSDQRLFDSIRVDTARFAVHFLNYSTPPGRATMNSFARQLSLQIDTTNRFVLIGTSMGGMLSCEMQSFMKPEKVILISSASNRKELPFRYRFQKVIPLYEIFPSFMLSGGARIMQPIVEPDRKRNKETFKSMIGSKSGKYMKRTVRMIIRWKRTKNAGNSVRIHGTKDHTIPIRNISNVDYILKGGSHMLTLTEGAAVSVLINKILNVD